MCGDGGGRRRGGKDTEEEEGTVGGVEGWMRKVFTHVSLFCKGWVPPFSASAVCNAFPSFLYYLQLALYIKPPADV